MSYMHTNIYCKCSIRSNITSDTLTLTPSQKEQDLDGTAGTELRASNIISGRGADDQKNDISDDDDTDRTTSKEEEDMVEKEEQEFTRWFGSLKDEENVEPKEEAVQVCRTLYVLCGSSDSDSDCVRTRGHIVGICVHHKCVVANEHL
jgi:hypothetical protein